ncbi:hypothetical protein AAZR23_12030 [Morganella sp. Je.2.23]|uniref:hypothetical protein n=1 Tax=Morganella sp. Je.2.23 TaxID=3142840 RepID=UPI003DA82106
MRAVTPLTPQIDISRVRTDEFCMPVYAAISDDDIRLKDEYIAELQAQGVDKLADSIQDIYDALMKYHCNNDILITLRGEISRCRLFAEKLRSPSVQFCDCDNCTCTTSTNALCESVMTGHTNLCDNCRNKLNDGGLRQGESS